MFLFILGMIVGAVISIVGIFIYACNAEAAKPLVLPDTILANGKVYLLSKSKCIFGDSTLRQYSIWVTDKDRYFKLCPSRHDDSFGIVDMSRPDAISWIKSYATLSNLADINKILADLGEAPIETA